MKLGISTLFGIAAIALASASQAQVFITPQGSKIDGDLVSAQAVFTVSAGHVHIVVNNLVVNPKDVGQNISDLGFTVSTKNTTGGSLVASSGTERTIAGNGTFTDSTSAISTGWVLDSKGAPFHLNGLGGAADTPAHTIIGSPNGSGVYSKAKNSIAGNGPHNPFLAGPISFDVNILNLPSNAFVNSAFFSFGTETGDNISAIVVTDVGIVPEAGNLALLTGLTVTGLGVVISRRFRRK